MNSGIVLLCLASFTLSAESQCSNVIVSPVIGTTLDTGSGQFHLSPFVLGPDTPTLYTDFDTLVNFTQGSDGQSSFSKRTTNPRVRKRFRRSHLLRRSRRVFQHQFLKVSLRHRVFHSGRRHFRDHPQTHQSMSGISKDFKRSLIRCVTKLKTSVVRLKRQDHSRRRSERKRT